MFERRRSHRELPPEFDELAGELRAAGLMTPTPQPSLARRAELRAAVLARKNERHRAGVGGFRGVAMGMAVVAGGGMVIASAAGGGNPATFVAEVVREIPVPVSKHEPRERPVDTPGGDVASRSPETPALAVAENLTPQPRRQALAATSTPGSTVEAPTPTPTAAAALRPSNTGTGPTDDGASNSASDSVPVAQPTSKPAVAASPDSALSNAAPATSRTTVPTSTPTPAPTKAGNDPAPAANVWAATPGVTTTPTPTPIRPVDTSNTLEPLIQDKNEPKDGDDDLAPR